MRCGQCGISAVIRRIYVFRDCSRNDLRQKRDAEASPYPWGGDMGERVR